MTGLKQQEYLSKGDPGPFDRQTFVKGSRHC